jgi:hypothetical protein
MPITTYSELQTVIADFLDRDDQTTRIQTFIDLAEATMDRQLRHWRMERRSNATVDTQYTALPSDFLEPVRFVLQANPPHAVELVGQAEIMDRRQATSDTTGKPRYYAVTDGTIELFPTPDTQYTLEMVYYSSIDKLSGSNASNWVLQYHPDAYLYGALIHSAPFLGEDARMQTWAALFQSSIDAINVENERAKSGGSGRRLKIRSY